MVKRLFRGFNAHSLGYRQGIDTLYSGPGRDLIDQARLDGNRGDAVGDVAYIDSEDTVVDCKVVYGVRLPE